MPQDVDKPAGEDFSKSLKRLEEESSELKSRIDRERRARDMPVDAQLGDPKWEEKAADGRFIVRRTATHSERRRVRLLLAPPAVNPDSHVSGDVGQRRKRPFDDDEPV